MVWNAYNSFLHRFPVPTEMVTSGVLWASGDILAQYLERRFDGGGGDAAAVSGGGGGGTATSTCSADVATLDWNRARIQTIYAALIWAPFGHYWYQWLDKTAHSITPPGTRKFVGVKLVLEMILLHPIGLTAFFVSVGFLGGEKLSDILVQLRKDFIPSILLEYALWTPFDLAMFCFIPVKHQLLVVNTICLIESVMLSYIKSNGISLPGHGSHDDDDSSNKSKKSKDTCTSTKAKKE